jgi:mRNA interferase MazF
VRRGEIWVAQLEPRKGSEVGKQRPVLVCQTDLLNRVGHPTVIILPITSQQQSENLLRHKVECSALHNGEGFVLIDQVRAIDSQSRMKEKIGELARVEMDQISRLVKLVLDL